MPACLGTALTALTSLDLSGNPQLTGAPMPPMAELTQLSSLSMRGTGVTALPADFCRLPRAVPFVRLQCHGVPDPVPGRLRQIMQSESKRFSGTVTDPRKAGGLNCSALGK